MSDLLNLELTGKLDKKSMVKGLALAGIAAFLLISRISILIILPNLLTGSIIANKTQDVKWVNKSIEVYANTSLDVSSVNETWIKVSLTLDNSTPLKTQSLKIYLNDSLRTRETDEQGEVLVDVGNLSGSLRVEVEYSGDSYFNPSSISETINRGKSTREREEEPSVSRGLQISYSDPAQGEVELGEKVSWTKEISVHNPTNRSFGNYSLNLRLPQEAMQVFSERLNKVNDSYLLDIGANESLTVTVEYKTPAVEQYILDSEENETHWSQSVGLNTSFSGIYYNVTTSLEIPEGVEVTSGEFTQNNTTLYLTLSELNEEEVVNVSGVKRLESVERGNLSVTFSTPEQGEIEPGRDVSWQQSLTVKNIGNDTLYNQSIDLKGNYINALPEDAFEIELSSGNLTNTTLAISEIRPNKTLKYELNYETPKVSLNEVIATEGSSWRKHLILNTSFSGTYSEFVVETTVPSSLTDLSVSPSLDYNLTNESLSLTINSLDGEFEVNLTGEIPFTVSYGNYTQVNEELEIGEKVNWTQEIFIQNNLNGQLTQNVTLEFPAGISNLKLYSNATLISNSSLISLTLHANEKKSLLATFQTPGPQISIFKRNLEVLDMIPQDAKDIDVYENGELKAHFPDARHLRRGRAELPAVEKKLQVYHNSSLHYNNIVVSIPIPKGNLTFYKEVNKTEVESRKGIRVREGEERRMEWRIERLSTKNLTIKERPVKTQGKAKVNEEVNWSLTVGNHTIKYKTPAPEKREKSSDGKKQITVYSNSSSHYHNVTSYTSIPEISYTPEFYRIVKENVTRNVTVNSTPNSTNVTTITKTVTRRVEVSSDPLYNVTYLDTNANGKFDRIEWNVPRLSEDVYEVEITVLNVQSYPTVGGFWTVRFNTTGLADLIILPVDGTSFAEKELDNSSTKNDLDFSELKKGEDKVTNYYYLVKPEDISKLE